MLTVMKIQTMNCWVVCMPRKTILFEETKLKEGNDDIY